MANPTRPMISGRDYQIRYALWRMLDLVVRKRVEDMDILVRVEWELEDCAGKLFYPDVMLEKADGRVLEIIECKEHDKFFQDKSLIQFAQMVRRAWGSPRVSSKTRFRLVSPASLLRLQNGKTWDLSNPIELRDAIVFFELDSEMLADGRIQWDFGHRKKTELTSEFLLHLMSLSPGDVVSLYCRYYSLLTAHMARRTDANRASDTQRAALVDDLLLFLSHKLSPEEREELLASATVDAIRLCDFRDALRLRACSLSTPIRISKERIQKALRRRLFDETVTLEQIYVPQLADLTMPQAAEPLSHIACGEIATDLLFRWLLEVQQGKATSAPLLVIGTFGAGKSSLLTWFALTLLERSLGIVPLLIPLRSLRTPSSRPVSEAIIEFVKREWGVALDGDSKEKGLKYCLLCDGFDELNLYYLSANTEQWVRDCFLELRRLAERDDTCLIISSRPVLFMDVTRRTFEGSDCPRMSLQLFDESQISQWCANYRKAASLPESFNVDFLEERGLLPEASTPIILYMTARLVESNPEAFAEHRFYSKAEIYRRFVDWTCAHGGYAKDEVKHRVPGNFRQILQQIAWQIFRSGSPFVDEGELLNRLREKYGKDQDRIPIDRNLLVAHMLQPAGERTSGEESSSTHLIEFTHQSFREYLTVERVWNALEPVRKGEELIPRVWLDQYANVFSTTELELFSDLVATLDVKEALNLYNGLQDAATPLYYWKKWFEELWRLRIHSVDEIAKSDSLLGVDNQPVRACLLSALAILLRFKCLALLRKAHYEPQVDLKLGFNTQILKSFLRFQESIVTERQEGYPWEARNALLQNL